jgi:hypothetical protein
MTVLETMRRDRWCSSEQTVHDGEVDRIQDASRGGVGMKLLGLGEERLKGLCLQQPNQHGECKCWGMVVANQIELCSCLAESGILRRGCDGWKRGGASMESAGGK